nr:hypothetical protein OG781_29020 [Streptomyces sp. NBC_00830]
MPRAIWRGAISFGLAPSPFQVVAAAESRDITLHRVHEKDGAER